MAAILLNKEYLYTRTWVIEGFEEQRVSSNKPCRKRFCRMHKSSGLLQRLLSRHLTTKDIIDGSTTLRNPFHNLIFRTPVGELWVGEFQLPSAQLQIMLRPTAGADHTKREKLKRQIIWRGDI